MTAKAAAAQTQKLVAPQPRGLDTQQRSGQAGQPDSARDKLAIDIKVCGDERLSTDSVVD